MVASAKNTILLVEDDAILSDMTRYAFIDAGFNVIAVRAGEDALGHAFMDAAFDFVFTDIHLDGPMNGWELAESLRDMRPSVPIVCTSNSLTRAEIAEHPGLPIISKPYRTADVIAMAERMIEEARIGEAANRPKQTERLADIRRLIA